MISMPIEIYTDGSAIHNPGPSGFSYIIRYYIDKEDEMPELKEIEFKQGYRLSTNNRMEIMAGIYALKEVLHLVDEGTLMDIRQINLSSDSEYFCKAVNQNWLTKWQSNDWMTSSYQGKKSQPVKNKDLWEQVIEIQNELKMKNIILTMTHVAGHSGHEFNERCDELARSAASGAELIPDEAYEKMIAEYSKKD